MAGARRAGDCERIQPRHQESERETGRTGRSCGTAPRVRADPGGGGSNPRGAEAGTDGIARDTCREEEMNTDLLFREFATIATAPDGINELRNLILNLAFLGQLVTNNEKDESAKTTVERFFSENKQTNKLGISPKLKNFESNNLPKTWIQLPLINVLSALESGSRPLGGVRDIESGIPSIGGEHLNGKGGFRFEKIKFVSHEFYQKMSRGKIRVNDVLVVKDGATTGKVSLIKPDFPFTEACINEHVFICRFIDCIYPPYAFYYLFSGNGKKRILENFKGSAQGGINLGFAEKTIIPIAPLAEQHRIVAKVTRLMALCDELETRQQQERVGCFKLGTASLTALRDAINCEDFERSWTLVCNAFDLILDCPENVAVLRQTILHLAVQGRLVRQDLSDEPAEKILESMNAQRNNTSKLKYERSFPIKEDPFYILPENWIQTQVKCVGAVQIGRQRAPKHHFGQNMRPYLRVANVYEDKIDTRNVLQMNFTPEEFALFQLKYGDILLNEGQSEELVGRPAIFRDEIPNICFQNTLIRFRAFDGLVTEYALLVFRSYLHSGKFLQISKRTTNIAHLGTERFANMNFPLPPLAEQHRIVAKVDELMALCDALELRLKERAGVQGRLAWAVVRQVAG